MVKSLMSNLESKGSYEITSDMKERLKDFYGNFASEDETRKGIKEVYESSKYLIDTHTSVAYGVNKKYKQKFNDNKKTLIASTASPYKFTYAVMNALDDKFKDYNDFKLIKEMNKFVGCEEPKAIKDIEKREVLHSVVCNKDNMKEEIKRILNI